MTRLRPILLAALALLAPVPGLIAAGAGWGVVAAFAAAYLLGGTLLVLVPVPSLAWLVAALAVVVVVQLAAAVVALMAARRTRHEPAPWYRRWYAVPLWMMLAIGLAPSTWLGGASRSYSVAPGSMEPNLRAGERFIADRLANPAATALRRGDVVTLRRGQVELVKRVIGLPGDRVQMRAGRLVLDGEVVPRERAGDYMLEGVGLRIAARLFRETLSGATYEILDLTDIGPFDATPEFRVPDGHVFVMGDNRDNSLDSRAIGAVGFIPLRDVTGRARFVFWSPGSGRIGTRL